MRQVAFMGFIAFWITVATLWKSCGPVHADPAPSYPNLKVTPGAFDPHVIQSTIGLTICKPGYTKKVRNVPWAVKKKVFAIYGIDWKLHANYEVDHLVSLEIGGSNDIANLWPEPYLPKPGAREKDVVETYLKKSICSGALKLDDARKIIVQDWYRCYLEIKTGKECEVKK